MLPTLGRRDIEIAPGRMRSLGTAGRFDCGLGIALADHRGTIVPSLDEAVHGLYASLPVDLSSETQAQKN